MPTQRKAGISVQRIGGETLLYDEARHQAFCLNRTSSAVWLRCDGTRTVASLAEATTLELQAPVTEDLVLFTLNELRRDGLLEAKAVAQALPAVSRRTLMRSLGASAMLLLPAIAVVAPSAAAQQYNGCLDCPSDSRGATGAKAASTTIIDQHKVDYKKLQKAKEAQAATTDPFRLQSPQ